jgi:hypothetical protein
MVDRCTGWRPAMEFTRHVQQKIKHLLHCGRHPYGPRACISPDVIVASTGVATAGVATGEVTAAGVAAGGAIDHNHHPNRRNSRCPSRRRHNRRHNRRHSKSRGGSRGVTLDSRPQPSDEPSTAPLGPASSLAAAPSTVSLRSRRATARRLARRRRPVSHHCLRVVMKNVELAKAGDPGNGDFQCGGV